MPNEQEQPDHVLRGTDHPTYMRTFAQRIGEMLIVEHKAAFELGRMIVEAQDGAYWRRWPGATFTSFGEWAWTVMGFKARKAEHLAHNYKHLSAIQMGEDTKSRALRMGWTKLYQVLRVAKTEIVLLQWLDRIERFSINEIDLRAEISLSLSGLTGADAPVPATAPPAAPVQPREGRVDTSDPAPKARRRKTSHGTVDVTPPRVTPAPDVPTTPPVRKAVLKVVFEDEEAMRTTLNACRAVRERTGDDEMGNGRALALIATSYLASLPAGPEGGLVMELEHLIQAIEDNYRVKLQVAERPVAESYPRASVGAQEPLRHTDPLSVVMRGGVRQRDAEANSFPV